MIGVVVLSQGPLGREFLTAAEQVVGLQENVHALCLDWNDDVGTCGGKIRKAIGGADDGDGVIVLTDMVGGTPCNLATAAMADPGVAVVTGINLPMLIKVLTCRQGNDLATTAAAAEETGRKHIQLAGGQR